MIIKGNAVTYTEFGELKKVLSLTQFEIDSSSLKPNEFLLQAIATPINPSDLVQIQGTYPSPPTPYNLGGSTVYIGGNEGVFRVIEVGADAKKVYKKGDWVIPKLPSFGTWRTHALVAIEEDKKPLIIISSDDDEMTIEQAAVIGVNPCTAYQLIHNYIKDWKDGDWIIQNCGNSQVSRYLTQIARSENIKTISIVRNNKTKKQIDELYNLGATKVVNEEEFLSEDFNKTLKSWVGDGRVRLAANSLGGPTVWPLVRSLSQDGFLATYGAMSSLEIKYSLVDQLFKNITTVAYWLSANNKKDPSSKTKTIEAIIKLYSEGILKTEGITERSYDSDQNLLSTFSDAIEASSKGKQLIIFK
ncbi:uncharacterized protein PRCAT00005750001 [Priceomyces carsonii]|uniref:uncharacterized protein n=1 Tax=Priceomyces carsonii TaxID=28549 RepID=UPI002EDABC51|nr:unnamed protein product [Priceomyces carsonii]